MEAPEGKLCQTCTATLRGDNVIYDVRKGSLHHRKYTDLVASKNTGCIIRIWLWDKHVPPRPTAENEAEDFTEGPFQVLFQMFEYLSEQAIKIVIYIKCSWAAVLELNVWAYQPSKARQHGDAAHHPSQGDLDGCPWLKLDPHLGSSQDLETIEKWISACAAKHDHCSPNSSGAGAFLPTRVLDVQDAGAGTVRLRDRDDPHIQSQSPSPAYWTLSHRWGDPKAILQLCETTEARLRSGIPLQELPPTFRDAILLVHRLGYRYIWIDSLCVFQDSRNDWQTEANTMVDVYRYSFCNISATGASYDPSNTGLFCARENQRSLYPFTANVDIADTLFYRPEGSLHGPWTFRNETLWDSEVERAPISSRGWVVQERFLAARVLHFTRNQIYWECLENRYSSMDPACGISFNFYELSGRVERYKKSRLSLAVTQGKVVPPGLAYLYPRNLHTDQGCEYHREWGCIVGAYTGCALTKESDRFLAMSGIAKVFREANGDEYLAGLWKRTIYTDLIWHTNANSGVLTRRVTDAYAPSWSWASVVGGEVQLGLPHTRYGGVPAPLIRLVQTRVVPEPPDGDPMGLLRSAELDIECRRYYYRWRGRERGFEIFKDEARTDCVSGNRDTGGSYFFDTSDIVERFRLAEEIIEGVCVPVHAAYEGYGGGYNEYLMLEHDSGDSFRRIGVLRVSGIGNWISGWPDDSSPSYITLV